MTYKQSRALQFMVENGGNMYRAMIDAGYSPNTAKTPRKLTKSMHIQKYLLEHNSLLDKAISSLSSTMEHGSTREKLRVARFCLNSSL